MDREEEIRQIAYQIWEYEGCPDGRDVECWLKAEAIFGEREDRDSASSRLANQKEQPRRRGKRVLRLM